MNGQKEGKETVACAEFILAPSAAPDSFFSMGRNILFQISWGGIFTGRTYAPRLHTPLKFKERQFIFTN